MQTTNRKELGSRVDWDRGFVEDGMSLKPSAPQTNMAKHCRPPSFFDLRQAFGTRWAGQRIHHRSRRIGVVPHFDPRIA